MSIRRSYRLLMFLVMVISTVTVSSVRASAPEINSEFVFNARVADLVILIGENNQTFSLWGIDKIDVVAPVFNLKARAVLEKKIAGQAVTCTVKSFIGDQITGGNAKAQCVNYAEEDLSLFLLQQGYVSVNRTEIYGSLYEAPYIQAELQAQSAGRGLWATAESPERMAAGEQSKNFMTGAFTLTAVFIIAVGLLSFYILRGFGKVVDLQNQSLDLATRERALKDKEKYVIASLLHSEVRENKTKIDAYLMVYEETLKELSKGEKAHQYFKTGEMIQKQPALSRTVFDNNANKLELLGANFSSDVIHYYARIKSVSDYVTITPETSIDEARDVVRTVIESAQKLNTISGHLMERFAKSSALKQVEDEILP